MIGMSGVTGSTGNWRRARNVSLALLAAFGWG